MQCSRILHKLENKDMDPDIRLKSSQILKEDVSLELYKIRSYIENSKSKLKQLEDKLEKVSIERSRIDSKLEKYALVDDVEMGVSWQICK